MSNITTPPSSPLRAQETLGYYFYTIFQICRCISITFSHKSEKTNNTCFKSFPLSVALRIPHEPFFIWDSSLQGKQWL